MPTNLTYIRNVVEFIDKDIERLQEARGANTSMLEALALRYVQTFPERVGYYCCVWCSFKFLSFEQYCVAFEHRCHGVRRELAAQMVPNMWLDEALAQGLAGSGS